MYGNNLVISANFQIRCSLLSKFVVVPIPFLTFRPTRLY
jgi:hypothetical protein